MNKNNNKPVCEVDIYGTKRWWLNGKLYREDGPAVECANGDKQWRVNGKYHRPAGPAVECANGHKRWYLNGNLHREGGPAVECANGYKEWWLNGVGYTKQDYYRELVERGLCTEQEAFIELL
jgi:hypothetical protein